jgi:hypothetical protein
VIGKFDTLEMRNRVSEVTMWINRANNALDIMTMALEEIAASHVGTFDEKAGNLKEIAEDALREVNKL